MKPFLLLLVAASLALDVGAQPLNLPKKIMRERSYVRFVTKQMNVPVEGQFRSFDGKVTFDPVAPAATVAE